ncbi:MAG: 16S rRNA (uracil(1498)-N(3))-methyltransferase [Butyrivibrio sp.]|nr:16S rRNA (uracil(1498)-N(3))-methyltransferase [Butyrivibrio sp.]
MYHFFVDSSQITPDFKKVQITGSDYNHIVNVLRMKTGEQFSVSIRDDNANNAGAGDHNADEFASSRELFYEIEKIDDSSVLGNLCFIEEAGNELPSKIYLFQGLPKVDKMELIIQKAVELGAYRIIPMSTKRCIVKLDARKAENKLKRWQAIAEAAAKQSKRGIIPKVTGPMTMKEAISFCEKEGIDVKLIPYEMAKDFSKTKSCIEGIGSGQSVAIFIGPEGGFTEDEIGMSIENGIIPITLGRRILRTETAGFTAISWLMYHLEQTDTD